MINSVDDFRAKLGAKQLCLGAGITLTDPAVIEALGPSLDFFWIDLEHTPISLETLLGQLVATRATATPGLVRVPGSDWPFAKRVLDLGAEGIIFPQLRTADEVRELVSCCRYPPLGNRGWGPRRPSDYGRRDQAQIVREGNEGLFVVAQIENAQAVEEVDKIVAVEGLDALVVGPYDLSASLGVLGQIEHPRVLKAVERVIGAAHGAGMSVGFGDEASAESATRWVQMGADWIQIGCDFAYLIKTADELIRKVRQAAETQR